MEKLIAEYTARKNLSPPTQPKLNNNADYAFLLDFENQNGDKIPSDDLDLELSDLERQKREEIHRKISYFVRKLRIARKQLPKRKKLESS